MDWASVVVSSWRSLAHLPAASSAALYLTQSGHVSVLEGVGGRPYLCLILQRIPWHGLVAVCLVALEGWGLCCLLHFFMVVGGGCPLSPVWFL